MKTHLPNPSDQIPPFKIHNFSPLVGRRAVCKFDVEIPGVVLIGCAAIEKQNGGHWLASQSSAWDPVDGKRRYVPSAKVAPALAEAVIAKAVRLLEASQSEA